jgi:hypothetical protein
VGRRQLEHSGPTAPFGGRGVGDVTGAVEAGELESGEAGRSVWEGGPYRAGREAPGTGGRVETGAMASE